MPTSSRTAKPTSTALEEKAFTTAPRVSFRAAPRIRLAVSASWGARGAIVRGPSSRSRSLS